MVSSLGDKMLETNKALGKRTDHRLSDQGYLQFLSRGYVTMRKLYSFMAKKMKKSGLLINSLAKHQESVLESWRRRWKIRWNPLVEPLRTDFERAVMLRYRR